MARETRWEFETKKLILRLDTVIDGHPEAVAPAVEGVMQAVPDAFPHSSAVLRHLRGDGGVCAGSAAGLEAPAGAGTTASAATLERR